jgi:hypothetical protein
MEKKTFKSRLNYKKYRDDERRKQKTGGLDKAYSSKF